MASAASASFLDSDFWCQTYGCAVVHDGRTYDIYDVWRFDTQSCCVGYGQPLINYYNTVQSPNLTGTLETFTPPDEDEGLLFALTEDGTTVSQSALDNGNGYLNAADSFTAFTLTPTTDVLLSDQGRQYLHSFFITSRNTRFSLRARASMADSTGDFLNTMSLEDIGFAFDYTRRGNDDGFDFGDRANTGNIRLTNGIDTLGDIEGVPTILMEFRRQNGIRIRDGDIDQQAIRLDFEYNLPEYDFSMGVGSLKADVTFDFYREN